MRFIYTDYMPNQFAILPAIGVIKKPHGIYCYPYRLSIIWGFWGISFGLGKPLAAVLKRETTIRKGQK